MDTFQTVGVVAALVINALLVLSVLVLARQVGLLLVKLQPARPLVTDVGVVLGTRVPNRMLTAIDGSSHGLGPSKSERTLLVFLSVTCPICASLAPGLRAFVRAYRTRVRTIVILTPSEKEIPLYLKELSRSGVPVCIDAGDLRNELKATISPFAVLLGPDNEVQARGTPNSLEQLESLIELDRYVERRMRRTLDAESEEGSSSGEPTTDELVAAHDQA